MSMVLTVDYKAIQNRLNALGAAPPLTADGSWGPKSIAALKAFQAARALKADGVPGPITLGKLGLASVGAAAVSTPKGSPADVGAYEVAKRAAPELSEAERQYALAVARGEGRFGMGWSVPPKDPVALAFAKSKGLTGTEGAGSNNWGAEQGKGDAGSFPHVDFGWKNPDGSPWRGTGPKVWLPYIGNYRRWTTPEKGFQSVAATILGGGKRGATGAAEIRAAIKAGDLEKAVYAQHANGYFELDPAKYLAAVQSNYAALTNATGWKALFGGSSSGAGSVVAVLVVVGGLAAAGAAWLLTRKA